MKDLKKQYNASLRLAKLERIKACEEDKETWKEIISDLNYVLDWLRSGRRPGNRRGVERKGYEQRTFLWSPDKFDKYREMYNQFQRLPEDEGIPVTDEDREVIKDALYELSDREKEVFVMSEAGQYSIQEIADALSISTSSVAKYKKRAQCKITKWRQEAHLHECS